MTAESWEETLVQPEEPLQSGTDVRVPRPMPENTLTPWVVSGQAAADPARFLVTGGPGLGPHCRYEWIEDREMFSDPL